MRRWGKYFYSRTIKGEKLAKNKRYARGTVSGPMKLRLTNTDIHESIAEAISMAAERNGIIYFEYLDGTLVAVRPGDTEASARERFDLHATLRDLIPYTQEMWVANKRKWSDDQAEGLTRQADIKAILIAKFLAGTMQQDIRNFHKNPRRVTAAMVSIAYKRARRLAREIDTITKNDLDRASMVLIGHWRYRNQLAAALNKGL